MNAPTVPSPIRLRWLSLVPYQDALDLMRAWTAVRHQARRAKGADASHVSPPASRSAGEAGNGQAAPPPSFTAIANPTESGTSPSPEFSREWPDPTTAAQAGDEIWLLQHPPVFTLGMNSEPGHLLAPGDIPVVPTERGGQVTYHGPGQIMAYLMLDLRARKLGIRVLVERIEDALIQCLSGYGITAIRQDGAPGIYVHPRHPASRWPDFSPANQNPADSVTAHVPMQPSSRTGAASALPARTKTIRHLGAPAANVAKIASIGLKTSNGFSYHGLALNGQMDLSPFLRIHPCGFHHLQMTDVRGESPTNTDINLERLALNLGQALRIAIER